jgi:fumarate hydratase class I
MKPLLKTISIYSNSAFCGYKGVNVWLSFLNSILEDHMSEPLKLDLVESLLELVRKASTDLPQDMVAALARGKAQEEPGSAAEQALGTILQNVEMARENSTPICQDTGTPIFEVHYPFGVSTRMLKAQIEEAVAQATALSYLRPNAVDSLTGKNSGNNLGVEFPTIHFYEWDEDRIFITLQLKGGGSENVAIQYKLPDSRLGAGRDLEGVRRMVLDGVMKAQGKGCAPAVLGVAIGGDRGTGYIVAKKQLLRKIDDVNPNPDLAALEERIFTEANELGIGPMGFGGKTTVLGVKIGVAHRLPACYFVTVAYMCWANRRAELTVKLEDGKVAEVSYA